MRYDATEITPEVLSHVLPVTRIDGQRVGDGKPGPITRRLREHYLAALGTDP